MTAPEMFANRVTGSLEAKSASVELIAENGYGACVRGEIPARNRVQNGP